MKNVKSVIAPMFLKGVCATSLSAEYNLAIRFAILFGVASASGLFALLTTLLEPPKVAKTKMVFIFARTVNKRVLLNVSWKCPVLEAEALTEHESVP